MPILLVSLGTSWAVVPEAFHALPPGPNGFTAVHVLTTSSQKIDAGIAEVRTWFTSRHPAVKLTITRVAGFEDLRSEADHFLFEEVLFRWLLSNAPDPATRHFCLAGGFKTMAAAMQRAASIFGAADVFHVLADPAVNTPALVDAAVTHNGVSFVRLGAEPGWPQMASLRASDFPLTPEPLDHVSASGYDLSNRVANLLASQRHLITHFPEIAGLPFPALALRAPTRLAWLRQPLRPTDSGDLAWLARLPKIELHCHLGGFATHGTELVAVRAAAENPAALPTPRDCMPPVDWPLPPAPCGLEAYRHLGDNNGSALLRDPGCLREQCKRLYTHLVTQRIIYAEIRCSPANYTSIGRSSLQVLTDIKHAFDDAMASSPGCHINLLIIGTRQDRGDFRTAIGRHLSLAVTAAEMWTDEAACRVVGVDLAGFEDVSTRAHFFRDDFRSAHRCNLALTVHAGENDDAEGIWSAVLDLNARRLGHALSLRESPELRRTVADRGIAIEMCPYANVQIKGYALDAAVISALPALRYPLLDYLRAGIHVTVNTDNIGISAASLIDNHLLAARLCPGLTRLDILQMQRHGIDSAFVSPEHRARLLDTFSADLPR